MWVIKKLATCVLSRAAWIVLTLFGSSAWAGNGFNLIGTGAESISMGGADVAVTADTSTLVINPAGLSQIADRHLDLTLYPFYGAYRHADELGNDQEINAPVGVISGGGYAQRLKGRPDVVLGVGLNVQGGVGFTYNNLQTPFGGPRDDISSIFSVIRLAFGGAWQATEQLSIGAAGGISYASARQKFFPQTADAATSFAGFRFDGGHTVQLNGAAGLLYKPIPTLRLGLSYTSKIKLPLKHGTANFNYEAIGEGRVRYADARIDGLSLPQEISAGFAWQATPRWLLAADVKWLDWSVVKNSRLRASQPDNPNVPSVDQTSPANFRGQTVFAAGLVYRYDDKTLLRAGTNLSRNPVPKETLSPLLNLVQTHEVDFGVGRKLGDHWNLDTAVQIVPPQSVRYNSPVFGDSKETFEAYSLIFTLSRSG